MRVFFHDRFSLLFIFLSKYTLMAKNFNYVLNAVYSLHKKPLIPLFNFCVFLYLLGCLFQITSLNTNTECKWADDLKWHYLLCKRTLLLNGKIISSRFFFAKPLKELLVLFCRYGWKLLKFYLAKYAILYLYSLSLLSAIGAFFKPVLIKSIFYIGLGSISRYASMFFKLQTQYGLLFTSAKKWHSVETIPC